MPRSGAFRMKKGTGVRIACDCRGSAEDCPMPGAHADADHEAQDAGSRRTAKGCDAVLPERLRGTSVADSLESRVDETTGPPPNPEGGVRIMFRSQKGFT